MRSESLGIHAKVTKLLIPLRQGDLRRGVGGDVDAVHLALDAAFGAFSMLGVAWIASIAI